MQKVIASKPLFIKTLLKIFGIVLLIIIILVCAFLIMSYITPAVPNDYVKKAVTGGEIEATYQSMGEYEVKNIKVNAPKECKKFDIYYPAELENKKGNYPVVVLVNGTGVTARKYPAVFKHLASWGFIVIGNEDPATNSGKSADMTLAYILEKNKDEDSIFYNKVDLENIGIAGYSQGGAGMFNAITVNDHSDMYKVAVALSPANQEIAAKEYKPPYDITKVNIPVLMMAGDGDKFETDYVIPLEKLKAMYEKLQPTPKIMARRIGSKHSETLYECDGYLTAWFMYWLKDDDVARKAFFGDNAELLTNPNWHDVKITE